MGKWCLHASKFIFYRIIIKVAGNQDRHKSLGKFNFAPPVSMHHLYVFLPQVSDFCPIGYLFLILAKHAQQQSCSWRPLQTSPKGPSFLQFTSMRVLQKVLSQGSDYFSAMFYPIYFYYKPSKYFPFTETHFCNLFTQLRKADK